jgi:hypothetical protein
VTCVQMDSCSLKVTGTNAATISSWHTFLKNCVLFINSSKTDSEVREIFT